MNATVGSSTSIEQKVAVIYANENNIWDNQAKKFHFFRRSIDEASFAMPLEEAKKIFSELKETGDYDEKMYLSEGE